MIEKSTLAFLKDLRKNNNRDWFKTNKPRYEEAKANVEVFLDALIQKISKWDPSISHHTGKSVMFRIYRDVRFSKDKSPYKTHFGAHISGAEKKSDIHSRAGYYIHIGSGESMIAGGAYMPQGPWIKNIRAAIDSHPAELKKILNRKVFKDTFGEIEGDKLKTAPKGYPKDHPEGISVEFQSENGLLGMGPFPYEGEEDADLINAGKQTVTMRQGGSIFDSSMSFAMIRGKHIQLTVLGAMEVSDTGDIANWKIPGRMVKGMGGAMDLVASADNIILAMSHTNKKGASKLLPSCTLPLTGVGCVKKIVTNMAVLDVGPDGFILRETAPGVSIEDIQKATAGRLVISEDVKEMQL